MPALKTGVRGKRSAARAKAQLRDGALSEHDVYLFREGTHGRLYRTLGCHPGASGASFAVWAPNAERVSIIGDFNGWNANAHPLAFLAEAPPATASRAWSLDFEWGDGAWMQHRRERNALSAAMSIYEVHLGSWRRGDDNRLPTYRDIAQPLAEYALDMGFTHVQLMPITEHPFYGSWGYQTTGYFAPTSRYGTPQDFMYLVDVLHGHGIGVILDWVPSHFPGDAHGLAFFDGTHLYEHADPRQGFHPEWNSAIFNYGRNEVRSFLLSSALFWLDRYHIDGLRVDAVASMLYLDGLGFGMKWNMGWMHDTLDYVHEDPVYRKYHHDRLTFSLVYAFNENFV